MDQKECSWCGESKPLDEFYKAPRGRRGYPDGRMAHCRECHKAQCFEANIKRRYGLTIEEYHAMKAAGCGICGRKDGRIVMDHDHRNGKVRLALCNGCNVGLGSFEDDPARMRAAAAYVEEWQREHGG